jgi:hypothetical protein
MDQICLAEEALHQILDAPVRLRAQLRDLRRAELCNTDPDVTVMIADQRKNVMAQLDQVWIDVCTYDMVMPGFSKCYSDAMIKLMGGG